MFESTASNFGHLQEAAQYKKPAMDQSRQSRPESAASEQNLNWFRVEDKNGKVKFDAQANFNPVDVTSISIQAEEVSAPKSLNLLGYKIELGPKVESFKENYLKNFGLTKSHNLMVARFAELKTAFLGYLLSTIGGYSSEDLRKLQKKAIGELSSQNRILFEENEYNGELLSIVGGGGKKQAKAQQKIIGEIRSQLIAQANNLGMKGSYEQASLLEIQISQCEKILYKFKEEKANLEYQLAFMGRN